MSDLREFGKRRPQRLPDMQPAPTQKRSSHVALLVMGACFVGGGAYAVMERQNCPPVPPAAPGVSAPVPPQGACTSRGSSYTGHSSGRYGFFSSGSSGGGSTGGSDSASSSVSRAGFGSFGRAFGFGGG